MATLNPQSLVTLWQIEQYGSFSATAKATGWSQPAISQQIKKLEAQCGSTLVQRTSHGVELTATGSMLARHGEAIADRLERAAREVEDVQEVRDAAVAEHGGGIGLALGNQTDRLRRLHLNQAQLDVREHTELDHGTGRDSRAD